MNGKCVTKITFESLLLTFNEGKTYCRRMGARMTSLCDGNHVWTQAGRNDNDSFHINDRGNCWQSSDQTLKMTCEFVKSVICVIGSEANCTNCDLAIEAAVNTKRWSTSWLPWALN